MSRKDPASRRVSAKPLPGFPRNEPFSSMAELRDYFAQDRLVCFLCGRSFVKLSSHVFAVHNMMSDDYKILYGIPVSYGLGGKAFRDSARRISRRLRKEGVIPPASPETIKKMLHGRKTRRPVSPTVRRYYGERLAKMGGRPKQWRHEDYEEVLRRVMTGRTLREVEKDEDMPSAVAFHTYLKTHPDLKRRYYAYWERQPFAVQAKAQKVGERYYRTLVSLRQSGNTWPQVAEIMQISEGAARNMWHELKRSGRLEKYLNAA